eukprot:912706-Rhodomonas_salina.1
MGRLHRNVGGSCLHRGDEWVRVQGGGVPARVLAREAWDRWMGRGCGGCAAGCRGCEVKDAP